MTHAEMDELYELYTLGVLEPEPAAEIHEHLGRKCQYCLEHVREAVPFAAALAGIADQKRPPDSLRERVLASVSPIKQRPSRKFVFAIAGLSAACLALLIFSVWSQNELGSARDRLIALDSERTQLREALQIMSRSDTRTVQFGATENVPHGRVFVNSRGGLVFVASRLPQLAPDRTFELWLVPRAGAPRPAGMFRANRAGDSVHVSSAIVDPETKAIAVSIEPQQGSPAPTTTPILAVPLE